ncbi:hypothetical protein [Deinococcus murrayi]|uniref:hypothetical protein n=1 Tax=Deinococcus murrayi TaxID=68910 RepID=UPI000484F35B|nr:hypothetical protein [Deinococcus murrayi]
MTGPKKGSRGRTPKRNTAQGRGGITRDASRPAREPGGRTQETQTARPQGRSALSSTNPARRKPGERSEGRGGSERPFQPGSGRKAPPKVMRAGGAGGGTKPLPDLKRVQLDAPDPDTVFRDRDGERLTFPDSALKRVAARILTGKNKAWRYRAFPFPLFTDRGGEQSFYFDFYIYDAEDSVIRLILVVPFESREVWDRVGRFKRQYPMYRYELWTPERLAQLERPRAQLGF